MKGSEIIAKELIRNGVSHIFGIPGTHNLSFYDALTKTEIKSIQTTQEQSAVFMADVYGRVSHNPGLVVVTSGPGALNTVNGVAQAYVESSPVVVLSSQINKKLWGKGCYHELKNPNVQLNIFREITKWSTRILNSNEIVGEIRKAFYKSYEGRPRPIFIEIPEDVFEEECDYIEIDIARPKKLKAKQNEIDKVIELVKKSNKPLIFAGGGILISGAKGELKEFSTISKIPIVTTVMGKSAIEGSFHLNLGLGSGIIGSNRAKEYLKDADLIIAIGTRFDEIATGFFSLKLNGKLVHIDIDPTEFNKNYMEEISVVADAKMFLTQMINEIKKLNFTNDYEIEKIVPVKEIEIYDNDQFKNVGVNPGLIVKKLLYVLKDKDSIFIGDSGNSTSWLIDGELSKNQLLITPSGYNSMGFSVPGAIGAKIASPKSVVFSFCGDGSFLMTGLEILTAIKYNIDIKVIVLHEKKYNILQFFQNLKYGGRFKDTNIKTFDFAKFANDAGALGLRLYSNKEIDSILEKSLSHNGPVVIEAIIDHTAIPPAHQVLKTAKK